MKPQWRERALIYGPYFTLCLTERDFTEQLDGLGITSHPPYVSHAGADATTHHLSNRANERVCIVCIKDWYARTGIEVAGLLVHEATHIWQEWLESVGEHAPGRETAAYAIQSLSQELMLEFARQTGVQK